MTDYFQYLFGTLLLIFHLKVNMDYKKLKVLYIDQLDLISRLRDQVQCLREFKKATEDVLDENELVSIYDMMDPIVIE
jgi:hypothetical protein